MNFYKCVCVFDMAFSKNNEKHMNVQHAMCCSIPELNSIQLKAMERGT